MNSVTINTLFIIFFGAIIIDFLTGILVSAKKGRLKSRTCSNGMFRSMGECVVLGIFIFITYLIPGLSGMLSTFIIGFIFKEGISICENLIGLDVWIPESIKNMFEINVKKVDNVEMKNINK